MDRLAEEKRVADELAEKERVRLAEEQRLYEEAEAKAQAELVQAQEAEIIA